MSDEICGICILKDDLKEVVELRNKIGLTASEKRFITKTLKKTITFFTGLSKINADLSMDREEWFHCKSCDQPMRKIES